MRLLITVILFALTTTLSATAQQRVGIAYYDVGRLYDTEPSQFYDDSPYTPSGENRWGESRYRRKVEHIAAVIDSMQMPIVALYGVENEAVVRDIVTASEQDYNYIHRTIDFYDGLDFALLYFGDCFFVEQIRSSNYSLYVAGEIYGSMVEFHFTRWGKYLYSLYTPVDYYTPDARVVCGFLTAQDMERLEIEDLLLRAERQGYGDSRGDKGWYFNGRIGSDRAVDGGVYITEWLLSKERDRPLPTFTRKRYEGGYSSHLPIYIILELK
ncbi:MAG: hypothetical protein R3Y16_00880 [Rikenellaceae bacterium]